MSCIRKTSVSAQLAAVRDAAVSTTIPCVRRMTPWGLALLLSACGGGSRADAEAAGVVLWRASGSLQCEAELTTQPRLDEAVAALKAAGVAVQSAQCAQDGRMRAAVCGTDKGEAWRVTVAAAAVDQALTQGWRRVEPGQEITPMACR